MNPLTPWMKFTLYFVAVYNVVGGLSMLADPAGTYRLIGIPRPESDYPLHLCGAIIGLFGVGYYQVARRPLENRGVLALGMASKLLGAAIGVTHVALGRIPPSFLPVVLVSDVIYVPLFWLILRRLDRMATERC